MISKQLREELDQLAKDFGREAILFYDIECYKYDSFVVFKNIDKEQVAYFHIDSGFDGMTELVEKNLLVGYNNYFYDDFVLTQMLGTFDIGDNTKIKKVNDNIINRGQVDFSISNYIRSLDCFQQAHVSKPSLKKVEANKGVSIEETQIGFDIDRKLTAEELEREIAYCSYDVDQTIDVFLNRYGSYFKPKNYVLKLLIENGTSSEFAYSKAYRWNTTTLATNVVKNDFKKVPRRHLLQLPEHIAQMVSPDVVEMWETETKGKIVQEHFNNRVEFGFGGLHSVHTHETEFSNVIGADFESLYPNIIINFRLLGEYTDRFKEIVDRRLFAKAEMKKLKAIEERTDEEERLLKRYDDEQGALKLVINSIYGLLKNEYSQLYNPMVSTLVCAISQCYIFELTSRLASCAKITQTNTDGTYFVPYDERWREICDDFAKEVNINLDYSEYERFIQKSVNDYIAIEPNGELYLKGGDTNMYFAPRVYQTVTARICQIALVDNLVYDKPVLDTLLENTDDPTLYQFILQAGGTYLGTFDTEGNQYQKVNRVFASKIKNSVSLKKVRKDGGMVSFANAPEKMFVWNKSVDELSGFDDIVDINHYYQMTNRMLELWNK